MPQEAIDSRHDRAEAGVAYPRSPDWLTRYGYWVVLPLTAVSYVFCATQDSPDPSAPALLAQLATVAVTLRVAETGRLTERLGWIALGVGAIATVAVAVSGAQGRLLDIVLSGASTVAFLTAPIAIVSHQARRGRVDTQALLAAIAAYVLIGMSFTMAYNFIGLVSPVATFGDDRLDSLASQLFFSFSTLTTTGYGNLVPVGAGVQTVAVAEAIVGQFFLVVAVARIISGRLRTSL
jgi:hypothetical protein